MSTTVAQAEALVRMFARSAKDTTMYPLEQVQQCIMLAGNEWVRLVKPKRTNSPLTLTASASALPALPAGFVPENLLEATLTLPGAQTLPPPTVTVISYSQLLGLQANAGTGQGYPRRMAFADQSTGLIYPTPDQAYTLTLRWWEPFTSWTPGSGDATVLNVDDEQVALICRWGAPYYLQFNEPENQKSVADNYQQFLEAAKRIAARDAGGRGTQVFERDTCGYDGGRFIRNVGVG